MEDLRGAAPVQPPAPHRAKRRWPLVGGLIALAFALGIGAYVVGSSIGVAQAASAKSAQAQANTTNVQQTLDSSISTQAPSAGPGMVTCEVLTVSSVSGQTIVAKTSNGSTVTIHTTSSTQYRQNGQSVSASAVKAGVQIRIRGTQNSDGSYTATSIDIS
jgi:hypothetical protein